MFKQLVLTTMMTTGVATVTPVYNAPKENLQTRAETTSQNIIDDYELRPTISYSNVVVNQQQRVNNTGSYYEEGNIANYKYNISGNNNYLNVMGNLYKTNVFIPNDDTPEDTDIYLYRNAEDVSLINNDQYATTQALYVLKVTPYNFNINTEIRLTLNIQIDPIRLYYADNDRVLIDNVYMKRDVYTTASSNWDEYIGQQVVREQCKQIVNEVKSVNNGFFYQEETNTKDLGYDEDGTYSYVDELTINITPKVDNYIMLNYIPVIECHMEDANNGTEYNYVWTNVMTTGTLFNPSTFTIYGTNVIVNGGYEVIDLPGLMWQILTMPFAFVSQAFNLTLFPGTPYQVNISNLFLSIVAIFVFVWLIGIFLKLKG